MTKARIEKFYRKNAKVIYPPVDVNLGDHAVEKGNYYLAGGRIVRAKHTDLIVKAFVKNGLQLKVIGKSFAGFEEELKDKYANKKNIEFLGEVDDKTKDQLMAGAKAFIFASRDEDFGIVPVESMMLGTPVIAHKSGGVMETIIEGKTGMFFDDLNSESLNAVVKKFEKKKFNPEDSVKNAERFSKVRFEKEIKNFVDKASK